MSVVGQQTLVSTGISHSHTEEQTILAFFALHTTQHIIVLNIKEQKTYQEHFSIMTLIC